MELDWSAQSPHIRTLYHPWQPGDGYDEATIQEAEARLGLRLPATLRNFYLAWGRREDMARQHHALLSPDQQEMSPDQLEIREDTLLFWEENQAALYWGVLREALGEADPPVMVAASGPAPLHWKPSHAHLSSFLDDMTYLHAFSGGAIHGSWTDLYSPALPVRHIAWLEEQWSKATVTPLAFGFDAKPMPTLYIRDGEAFRSFGGCSLAAREAEVVDEIAHRFQIEWAERW